MNIELREATILQKPILANLLELYSYDFTEFWEFDIGDDGFYGYKWLPLYWSDNNRFPFLVYVDGKIAGFVLVQKGSPISDNKDIYDIAEFFVMRKYRRKKIGATIATKIWRMFKGSWQIRVLPGNKIASIFWPKTINEFTNGVSLPGKIKVKNDDWLVYHFESP